MSNPEMITDQMDVQIADSIEAAPKYEKNWTMLRIEKAIIVAKGTKSGKPTVDIQMIDEDGKQFLVMATGGIVEMLAGAVKGVETREG